MPVATLGGNLRRLRINAGFKTQVTFGRELGVGSQAVSDWENDRRDTVGVDTLLNWAKVLKCSVEDFVEGIDEDYKGLGLTSPDLGASTNRGTGKKGGASDALPASAQARIRELDQELRAFKAEVADRALALADLASADTGLRAPRAHSAGRSRARGTNR